MSAEMVSELPQSLLVSLENYALDYLQLGRKEWDVPHTKAVFYHAVNIASKEGLDVLVLGTVGWLHDIGYYGLFERTDSTKLENIKDKKAEHMINGAKLARKFLEREDIKRFYTLAQRERIIHLVSVHDKVEELKDADEIAFMEADTLGAIDANRVIPTFDRENAKKYIEKDLFGRRFAKFATNTGISTFQELFPKFVGHYDEK